MLQEHCSTAAENEVLSYAVWSIAERCNIFWIVIWDDLPKMVEYGSDLLGIPNIWSIENKKYTAINDKLYDSSNYQEFFFRCKNALPF